MIQFDKGECCNYGKKKKKTVTLTILVVIVIGIFLWHGRTCLEKEMKETQERLKAERLEKKELKKKNEPIIGAKRSCKRIWI